MMSVHLARHTLHRELQKHLAAGTLNTGPVVITWDSAAVPTDPNVEADYSAPNIQTMTVQALIHFIPVKSVMSGWTNYQAGDAIITFDATGPEALNLAGKRTVTFTLPDGKLYLQKDTDRDPVEFWSTFIGGSTLTKTLLLRLKPGASAPTPTP